VARKDYVRIELSLPPGLAARLAAWRRGLAVPTSQNADICTLLDRALSEIEAEAVPRIEDEPWRTPGYLGP
jgi:hypothetical protein